MLQGLIMGLFAGVISYFNFKTMLKHSLSTNNDIDLFEYKGKTYDKNYFISLLSDSYYDLEEKEIIKRQEEYESELIDGKDIDLILAQIDACKLTLKRKNVTRP